MKGSRKGSCNTVIGMKMGISFGIKKAVRPSFILMGQDIGIKTGFFIETEALLSFLVTEQKSGIKTEFVIENFIQPSLIPPGERNGIKMGLYTEKMDLL